MVEVVLRRVVVREVEVRGATVPPVRPDVVVRWVVCDEP
jgi:hypothetical protein